VTDPLLLSGDALHIPTMPIQLELASGVKATLAAGGDIENLSAASPTLALDIIMPPVDLSQLGVDIPQIVRAEGIVAANLTVNGTLDRPRLGGRLRLDDGLLRLKGVPLPLDDIHVDVRVSEDEIRIRRASAKSGNTGRLELSGRLPLDGLTIGGADATLIATDVKLPIADGVKLTADARLNVTYDPLAEGGLPAVTGRVTLKQLHYTRPMNFTPTVGAAVVEQITNRRRSVESYDPKDDFVTFDVSVVSPEPVRIANNLLDMRLDVKPPGIQLSGTNQRFGARGALTIDPSSKLFLQRHHFQVQSGTITFDNAQRIAPHLDVTATTEYRRYQSSTQADAAATADVATSGSAGGRWRIVMHAYGDIDAPEVRFTSDPPLSQEDIVLLLQVGQTRAELERGLLSGIGQAVGLEALSAVTGLDKAFKDVPIIDEFRVGSQYSSRTGRPEPTVTFGKRLTDSVRASLTTGLSENREVRSNIEWQLKGGVSVSASYDNVNEVGSSSIGNIGGGLRWRLEFE
jgi:translocation and assembly module TamB